MEEKLLVGLRQKFAICVTSLAMDAVLSGV
jgi:hypothetical protein